MYDIQNVKNIRHTYAIITSRKIIPLTYITQSKDEHISILIYIIRMNTKYIQYYCNCNYKETIIQHNDIKTNFFNLRQYYTRVCCLHLASM